MRSAPLKLQYNIMPEVDEFRSKLPIRVGGKKLEHATTHHCICGKLFEMLYNNDDRGCQCDFCAKKGGSLQNLLGSLKDISNSCTQTASSNTTQKQTIDETNAAEKYIETLLEPKNPSNGGCGEHVWSPKQTQSAYSTSTSSPDNKSLEEIQLLLSTINENLESILDTLKEKKQILKVHTLGQPQEVVVIPKVEKKEAPETLKMTSSIKTIPANKSKTPCPVLPKIINNAKYPAANIYSGLPSMPGLLYRYKPASCPNINYFENLGRIYSGKLKMDNKEHHMNTKPKREGKKTYRKAREYSDMID